MLKTALIYQYCEVIKEVFAPCHAIYFKEDGFGYADVDTPDEGVQSFSCGSVEEFDELVELCADL